VSRIKKLLRGACGVWFRSNRLAVLQGRGMIIGRNVHIMDATGIDSSHCWHITMGDDVTLAPGVRVLAHDASTKMHLGYTRIGKVEIGNRVFVGASSVILPGVRIGSDVVIGAGSVVTRDVPDNTVAAGNPAVAIDNTDAWLERRRNEMVAVPCFGGEYTLREGITAEMKAEMNARMVDGIGYVY